MRGTCHVRPAPAMVGGVALNSNDCWSSTQSKTELTSCHSNVLLCLSASKHVTLPCMMPRAIYELHLIVGDVLFAALLPVRVQEMEHVTSTSEHFGMHSTVQQALDSKCTS
jgi:hypothetical protein